MWCESYLSKIVATRRDEEGEGEGGEENATKLFCTVARVSDVGSFAFFARLQGQSSSAVFSAFLLFANI